MVVQENANYLAAAKGIWQNRCNKLTALKSPIYKRMKQRWDKQLLRIANYEPFYKDLRMISLSYTDEDPPVEMCMTQNLLEVVCNCYTLLLFSFNVAFRAQ